MGEFIRYPGLAESITTAQLRAQPLTCESMRELFFGDSRASIHFQVTVRGASEEQLVLVTSPAIDSWAERAYTSVLAPVSFTVHWSYEFPIYIGLPEGQKPFATVRYRSSCTVRDLTLSVKRIIVEKGRTGQIRVAACDLANPSYAVQLSHANLSDLPVIVVMDRTEYASLDVNSIKGLVSCGTRALWGQAERFFTDSIAETNLKTGVADLLADHCRAEALNHCAAAVVGQLNAIASSFDISSCYNEATRRTITDVIHYSAMAHVGKHCKIGAPATLAYPECDEYIGTGRIDYLVSGATPVVGRLVLDTVPPGEDNLAVDDAEELRTAVTEAKGHLIVKNVAQLAAQLLDQLKSAALQKKRSRDEELGPTPARSARGILATGQKFLFFALKEAPAVVPELIYYGTWTLNILPGCRVGGKYVVDKASNAATPEKSVDREEVRQLLAAFVVFLTEVF